jgi:hypothetical protein
MGCDIHFVIEKKYPAPDGDRWVGVYMDYVSPPMRKRHEQADPGNHTKVYTRISVLKDRDYGFFAMLAGVRGDGPEPLGLPPDISEMAQLEVDAYGSRGHSHSWLTYREFCNRKALCDASAFEDKGDMIGLSGLRESEYDEYRVVFWFDN